MVDYTQDIYHGNTLVIPVELTDDEGNPISLSGATIEFALDDITEATTGYNIIRNDANGTFTITVDESLIEALDVHHYLFSIRVTYASGIVATVLNGLLRIYDDQIN